MPLLNANKSSSSALHSHHNHIKSASLKLLLLTSFMLENTCLHIINFIINLLHTSFSIFLETNSLHICKQTKLMNIKKYQMFSHSNKVLFNRSPALSTLTFINDIGLGVDSTYSYTNEDDTSSVTTRYCLHDQDTQIQNSVVVV